MNTARAIHHWLDHYLPPPIRLDQQLSHETRIRARTMVAVLGLSVIIPILLLVTYGGLHLLTGHDFSRNLNILIVIEILLVSQHLYFHSYGNLHLTAGAYSAQFLLITSTFVFLSGGLFHSPLLPILLCSPMIAFITISFRAALWHAGIITMVMAVLLLLHIQGISLPNYGHPENFHITQTVIWGFTFFTLMMLLLVTEQLIQAKSLERRSNLAFRD